MENNVSTDLFDLLVTRDFEPEILDSSGKPVTNPQDAELFSFDWRADSKNYGTVVILLGTDNTMEVYYGDNLGRAMDSEHRGDWYDFLAQLKNFAARNLLTFELNNINRLKYTMQGMAAIREGLFEGYYGRGSVSYADRPDHTRLMIRHSRSLAPTEARYRAIESIFVENSNGERFRVPSRNLMHGKILARHVAEGGTPYDTFGNHITDIITELETLSRFVRAVNRRDYDEHTRELVEAAVHHYADLKRKARRMIGRRGYLEARDQFDPAEQHDRELTVDAIRGMFIEQTVDPRIEQALPVLARIKENSMKEITEFESWAQGITEGTWAMPEDPESYRQLQKLLSEPLPVGPDAVNATEQLYDIFGDDDLFDRLSALAERDAEADARDIVRGRLSELGIEIEPLENLTPEPDTNMGEDLDTDGVMMTKPSNMSSESRDRNSDLDRLMELARR